MVLSVSRCCLVLHLHSYLPNRFRVVCLITGSRSKMTRILKSSLRLMSAYKSGLLLHWFKVYSQLFTTTLCNNVCRRSRSLLSRDNGDHHCRMADYRLPSDVLRPSIGYNSRCVVISQLFNTRFNNAEFWISLLRTKHHRYYLCTDMGCSIGRIPAF